MQAPTSTVASTTTTFMENRPGEHTRFSPIPPGDEGDRPQLEQSIDDTVQVTSPQSSLGSAFGTDVAPLRWFGLLAGDVPYDTQEISPLEALGSVASSQRYLQHPRSIEALHGEDQRQRSSTPSDSQPLPYTSQRLQAAAASPTISKRSSNTDERYHWRSSEPIVLNGHEYAIFERFVNGVSLWIDLFDPLKHFSTFVPHLALYNEGLMKALLALGARHVSIKPDGTSEATIDRTAAVQYYDETLRYLQSAMRFTSYKNSLELHATVLIVSTYEMLDGASKNWERHLKGVFWIQRSRDINGESGGLEQAIWWGR